MIEEYHTPSYCFSAVLTAFYPESVRDCDTLRRGIAEAKKQGYGAVEFFYEGTGKHLIAKDLISSGLRSLFLPAYHLKKEQLDLGSFDITIRKRALEDMRRYIDDARYYGSERVMFVSGLHVLPHDKRRETLTILADSITELCEYAQKGAKPLLVSIESFSNISEPHFLLGPTSLSVDFAHTVRNRCPNYGITIDLSHMMQMGEDPISSLRLADSVCDHIHIANSITSNKDHRMYGDKHLSLDDVEGDVTPSLLSEFLFTIGNLRHIKPYIHDLFLGLEVITKGKEKPEEIMANAKHYVEKILRESKES